MISLQGVGPLIAGRLKRLGIVSIQDLLFHLPIRYQDRTRLSPIGALRAGVTTLIQGTVELTQVQISKRRALLVRLSDGTGTVTLRFFHFHPTQQKRFPQGACLRCFGEVRFGPETLEMVHPEYQRLEHEAALPVEACLTPVYPTTEGLPQAILRRLSKQALECLRTPDQGNSEARGERPPPSPSPLIRGREGMGVRSEELLPEAIRVKYRLSRFHEALEYLHRPPPEAPILPLEQGLHPMQRRLAFEELLAHHLSLKNLRAELLTRQAPALRSKGLLAKELLSSLPFTLTRAQQRVIEEIQSDIAKSVPMLRLLQGDVGSGKTVVAALAALQAIECGFQAALMAPTELLAEQHYRTLNRWFAPLNIPLIWISGKLSRSQWTEALSGIAAGAAMVIGTHALFQEQVRFSRLGLIIVDEQHRFGVSQRLAFWDKGHYGNLFPHQLIMTATPIPRTLAMTSYADLDSSIIDELPPNRQLVRTIALPDTRRGELIERIARVCRAGRQVYWVCTLIEDSEVLQCQAATDTALQLAKQLPNVSVGLIHGRMKGEEREEAMAAFIKGTIELLVATTVIEVGVDVPKASLMVIENAERLGLAQLHQLRGRVGRGVDPSDCVLLYRSPLSSTARARLATLREISDGFAIAEKDLELRGPGELLGTRQAGLIKMRIADLARDRDLLPAVEETAAALQQNNPEWIEPLIYRWLGDAVHYGSL